MFYSSSDFNFHWLRHPPAMFTAGDWEESQWDITSEKLIITWNPGRAPHLLTKCTCSTMHWIPNKAGGRGILTRSRDVQAYLTSKKDLRDGLRHWSQENILCASVPGLNLPFLVANFSPIFFLAKTSTLINCLLTNKTEKRKNIVHLVTKTLNVRKAKELMVYFWKQDGVQTPISINSTEVKMAHCFNCSV